MKVPFHLSIAAGIHLKWDLFGYSAEQTDVIFKGITCSVTHSEFGTWGPGLNKGYRRSAANVMIIGAHLAKLSKELDGAYTTHCIGNSNLIEYPIFRS